GRAQWGSSQPPFGKGRKSSRAAALLNGLVEHPNDGFWMKRVFSQTTTMTRLVGFILLMPLMMTGFMGASGTMAESIQKTNAIPDEDYALYDQVVTSKFLTSATQLVVIERTTQFRLSPDQEGPTTLGAFLEREFFDGDLPADLIREFTVINRQPSRLEGRF